MKLSEIDGINMWTDWGNPESGPNTTCIICKNEICRCDGEAVYKIWRDGIPRLIGFLCRDCSDKIPDEIKDKTEKKKNGI